MQTKLIFPWNAKVGDFLVINGPNGGEYQAEILGISKGRASMFYASKWVFHTKEVFGFKEFPYYGKGFMEGSPIKAEKVKILKK
jgi:hypothetical protein